MPETITFGQIIIEKALIAGLEHGTVEAFLESLNSGWTQLENEGLIMGEIPNQEMAQITAQFPLFQRARLATAAPALLAALQDLLAALPAHSFPETDVAEKVRAAQEAVRLATGEGEEVNA